MSSIKLKGYPSFPNIYYDTFGNKLIISSNLKSENSYKSPSILYFLKNVLYYYIYIRNIVFRIIHLIRIGIIIIKLWALVYFRYAYTNIVHLQLHLRCIYVKFLKKNFIAIISHRYLWNCSKNYKDFCQTNLSSLN